ncbi:hypothetical protein QFZ83_002390 [Variovorax sp. W1I1]|uniref:hypothetical protein n=1 Tax=Variovorax sp. W1I1 TaxID=3042309 RepID=UPI002783F34C|nr:hypothetical protein [Variovorax sp. W1I1]MDQ0608219.1 hypothetical protein [Variovorax sp. W1I1]
MPSISNIKSISYLKSRAAQVSEDLEMNGAPFFITQEWRGQDGDRKRQAISGKRSADT